MRKIALTAALFLALVAARQRAVRPPSSPPVTGPTFSNEIVRMNLDGQVTDRYPIPTPKAGVLLVAVGPDGDIWFNEDTGNKIGRLNLGAAAE